MQEVNEVNNSSTAWRSQAVEIALLTLAAGLPIWMNLWSAQQFEPAKAQFLGIGVSLAVLVSMARGWPVRSRPAWPPMIRLAIGLVLALAATVVIATVASTTPSRSLWGSSYWRRGLLTELSELALFPLALFTFRSTKSVRRLLIVAALTSVPVSAYALIQALGLDPLVWSNPNAGRAFSTLGNPNLLAAYLAMVVPITVAQILVEESPRRRFLWLVAIGLQSMALLAAQSRGGYVATAVALAILAGVQRNRSLWPRIMLAVLALLLVVGAVTRPDPGATSSARLVMWQGALHMIEDHPWLGYGLEAFEPNFQRYQPAELQAYGSTQVTIDHAHNLWLDITAEKGVVGLTAYLAFLSFLVVVSVRGLKGCERGACRWTPGALVASMAAFIVAHQFTFPTIVPSAIFWICAGAIVSLAAYTPMVPVPRTPALGTERNTRRYRRGGAVLVGLLITLAVAVALERPGASPAQRRELRGLQDGWAIDNVCRVMFTPDVARQIKTAGAGWVRINFRLGAFRDWTETQTCHGRSAMDLYDEVIHDALTNGLQVLALLGPEAWPGTQSEWQANSAEMNLGNGDNSYIAQFATDAAVPLIKHFGERVSAWEIWNEPNAYTTYSPTEGYRGATFIYPSNLAWLLARIYTGTHGPGDVKARLVSGGIFSHDQSGLALSQVLGDSPKRGEAWGPGYVVKMGQNADAQEAPFATGSNYLRAVYEQGIAYAAWEDILAVYGSYPLDAIGQHLYIDQATLTSADRIEGYLQDVRNAYCAYEGSTTLKKTILTEVGWTSPGPGEQIQAQNLRVAYEQFAKTDYVQTAFWFQLRDIAPAELYYGLLTPFGSPWVRKPAWVAYRGYSIDLLRLRPIRGSQSDNR